MRTFIQSSHASPPSSTLPHCHPPPLPPEGVPPQIRGHSCSWEFLPQKRKNAGGGTRFGRGFMGKILGTGKTQEGVPLLEGGLPGNFEEREKRRLEPIQNGKIQGGGTLLEGGLPEKFGIKKISYYICGKE